MYHRQFDESGYLVYPAIWFSRVGNVLSIGTTIDMVVDLSTDERVPMLERADEK